MAQTRSDVVSSLEYVKFMGRSVKLDPVTSVVDLEERIKEAVDRGIFLDLRASMPKKTSKLGKQSWGRRYPRDVLGLCVHHNGSKNDKNFMATYNYHIGPNHISSSGLPTGCYPIMVPNDNLPPRLVVDLMAKTYAQGAEAPGDENSALVAVLIMGSFKSSESKGYRDKPTVDQMHKFWLVARWLQETFGFDNAGLLTHSSFGKAACPGDYITKQLSAMRNKAMCLGDLTSERSIREIQAALRAWNPQSLPKYGIDGLWGGEGKYWLSRFQQANRLEKNGTLDPFTKLKLFKILYPTGKYEEIIK